MVRFRLNHPSEIFLEKTPITPIILLLKTKLIGANKMKLQKKINCTEIEIAIARDFNFRQNVIIPNLSWGVGLHECDMIIISQSGYATEIEIKVTKYDLLKDFKKKHQHDNKKIKYLFFAVPEKLYELCAAQLPENIGIIVCKRYERLNNSDEYISAEIKRQAIPRPYYEKWSAEEIAQATRLGCMRIWGLKEKIIKLQNEN